MPEIVQEQQAKIENHPNSSVTGDLRLHDLRSKIFRNTRNLRVGSPGYDEAGNTRRYPVFYLQTAKISLIARLPSVVLSGRWMKRPIA